MNIIINDKIIIKDVTVDDIYSTFDGLPESTCIPVILEDGDNYVQSLSTKRFGMLEARFYNEDGFSHFRARDITDDSSYIVMNSHTESPFRMMTKNRLSTQTMRIVFTDFLLKRTLSSCVMWDNVTSEFTD
ncbi:MAG: hypothetical protein II936_02695 [Oscillospiraceae bacterium]|nr:hypothetical protein [Oscillospiraceae bacterium]